MTASARIFARPLAAHKRNGQFEDHPRFRLTPKWPPRHPAESIPDDRTVDGSVTDFIYRHDHQPSWPVFNVADAALLVGLARMLLFGSPARRGAESGSAAAR